MTTGPMADLPSTSTSACLGNPIMLLTHDQSARTLYHVASGDRLPVREIVVRRNACSPQRQCTPSRAIAIHLFMTIIQAVIQKRNCRAGRRAPSRLKYLMACVTWMLNPWPAVAGNPTQLVMPIVACGQSSLLVTCIVVVGVSIDNQFCLSCSSFLPVTPVS